MTLRLESDNYRKTMVENIQQMNSSEAFIKLNKTGLEFAELDASLRGEIINIYEHRHPEDILRNIIARNTGKQVIFYFDIEGTSYQITSRNITMPQMSSLIDLLKISPNYKIAYVIES